MEKRVDMFQFLREFTSFLHSLQQTREPFFKSLHEHGILQVIEVGLSVRDEKVNTIAIEILSQFVEAAPTLVREFILNEVESKSSLGSNGSKGLKQQLPSTPVSVMSNNIFFNQTPSSKVGEETQLSSISTTTASAVAGQNEISSSSKLSLADILNTDDVFEPVLINYVIRQMINDPDPELSGAMQIVNLLKLLIDPENMLSAANVSIFFIWLFLKSRIVYKAVVLGFWDGFEFFEFGLIFD
jgi:hypothetical protein